MRTVLPNRAGVCLIAVMLTACSDAARRDAGGAGLAGAPSTDHAQGGANADTASAGTASAGTASAGTTSQGPAPHEPEATWARDEDITIYGRATFALSPDGVAAEWGVIIADGPLSPRELLQGPILVVGLFNAAVRSTITVRDPREISGIPDPQSGMAFGAMLDEGSFTFSFPGQHVQTQAHLRASRFQVYLLGNTPFDIAVTPENIDALRAGATLLGVVDGIDMHDLYFE